MAYFPNGTAGEIFNDENCSRCINWRERDWRLEAGAGCPIWDLHLLLDQYGCRARGVVPSADPERGGLAITRHVLDFLIEEGPPQRCSMFVADGKDHDTLSLFPQEKEPT